MRVAAIDIGTNSTRMLVADLRDDEIEELARHSNVTRLGDKVDETGRLDAAACERVLAVLRDYRREIDELGAGEIHAIATSAVRDTANGHEFSERIAAETGIAARVIGGDEEAQLTFAGANHRGLAAPSQETVVIDIGGGSTEFIVGHDGQIDFHTSTQIGAVRHSERFLHSDPPDPDEIAELLAAVDAAIAVAVPQAWRERVASGIAVAGTPTVLASVDQQLEEFDPWKVHGYVITRAACERMLKQLGGLPLAERRGVTGLHPDRAPTIVAGAAILLAALDAFGLAAIEVSEHDILYGMVLSAANSVESAE